MNNNISALICACRKGNQLAQMQLYDKYCEAMFRIACRYSKTAVVAIYGNKSGDFISCPGDALPQDVVNLYDWVCIISIDKLVPIEN